MTFPQDFWLSGLFLALLSQIALAQGPPEISDPDFRLIPGFDAPGEFPVTVTATNMNITPIAGAEVDGFDEDVFRAEFPAAGPIKWTSSRMNAGDISLSIGPAFPDNPLSYPSGDPGNQNNFQAMNDDFAPIDPNSTELTTLSWRVSQATGAHFATTRHNGVDDGYVLDASEAPTGAIRGITYVSGFGGRQGWGFSMDVGNFENGGTTSTELHLGHAGDAFGANEAVFDIASAYFPYEEGWKGAWVESATDGPASFSGSSPNVDESEVTWSAGQATIQLTGVDSASDGMMFVAPADGSSTSRIAAGFPTGSGGWTTTVRLDADLDTTGQTYQDGGERFQFLYVPYDANDLIGGQVDGATGDMVNSAGDSQFLMTRTASGDYALSIFESDGSTKKNDDSGMLLLSVADTLPNDTSLGSRAFMSYEYDATSGDFIINSREFIDIDTSNPDAQDGYGNVFAGSDSDFYFAWVDFTNPLSLGEGSGPNGDFSGDGVWDCADINALTAAIAAGSSDLSFDMNGDGMVSIEDVTDPGTGWLAVGGANNPAQTGGNAYLVGDANLDGVV
ncbi:MAG: hypothetical protein AAF497_07395, partial [Planctomycetota bacterium]